MYTSYSFTKRNKHEKKTKFFYGGSWLEILISFLHSKKLGIPRTVFRRYHLGTFQICWNAKFQYSFYFWLCLETWSGIWCVSKQKIRTRFIFSRWTLFRYLSKYWTNSERSRHLGQNILSKNLKKKKEGTFFILKLLNLI